MPDSPLYGLLDNDAPQASAFDAMLEALPDELDFDAFMSPLVVNSGQELPMAPFEGHDAQPARSRPIDIASNDNNGEIAHIWDLTLDTLQVTPGSSGSATISAPNSFNSDFQRAHHNVCNPNVRNSASLQFGSLGTIPAHQNQSLMGNPTRRLQVSESSSPVGSYHQRIDFNSSSHKHPGLLRRSSSHLQRVAASDESGIGSSLTSNAIRKNSTVKPVSTTATIANRRGSSYSNLPSLVTGSPSVGGIVGPLDQPKKVVQCFNCRTMKTPLWRRSPEGNTLCNACGLFQKLHGTMRPLSLKTDIIKKRNSKKKLKQDIEQRRLITRPPMESLKKNSFSSLGSDQIKYVRKSQASGIILTNLQSNEDNRTTTGFVPTAADLQKRHRRSSASSNSSRSSSSRSMVPILPKPSPTTSHSNAYNVSATLNQFDNGGLSINNNSGTGSINSNASSPRYITPVQHSNSPVQLGTMLQNPNCRASMIVPRRKPSRSSLTQSSTVSVSLQTKSSQVSSPVLDIESPEGWPSINRRVANHRSNQNTPNTFINTTSLSTPDNKERFPHTSLLSQQLKESVTKKITPDIYNHLNHSEDSVAQNPYQRDIFNDPTLNYSDLLMQQRDLSMQVNGGETDFDFHNAPSVQTLVHSSNRVEDSGTKKPLTENANEIIDSLDWLSFGT